MRGLKILLLLFLFIIMPLSFFLISSSSAKVTGICSNCHTMHNSQNGQAIVSTGSLQYLLRMDCMGCHGRATSNKIELIGGTIQTPQVYHNDPSGDLAGGNFAYITGLKGTAADSHGHNIVELAGYEWDNNYTCIPGIDPNCYFPPGSHHDGQVANGELTCAGENGCHGWRDGSGGITGIRAMRGTHHNDVDGQLTAATLPEDSYRFLWGVKGLEVSNWQNIDANNHNEYSGAITAMSLSGCSSNQCHPGGDVTKIFPANQTISGFCATCHGTFHSIEGTNSSSPFKRHPTDHIIPNSGEYTGYTTYSIDAPVGRTTIPPTPSGSVQPGTDVVICLSCHKAHGSLYDDMLRWDYTQIVTGGSGGCHICHTQK